MVRYKIKITLKVIWDLDSIYEYIAAEKQAPENARGQVPTRNETRKDMLERVIGDC